MSSGTVKMSALSWSVLRVCFEQTLSTDQDNALIFTVPEDMTADQVREQMLPVARRINETLALCGFPLCRGNVMASNPQWCLSLEEWRGIFLNWITNGAPEALLHASIFFDFRSLYGAHALAEEWCLSLEEWRGIFLNWITNGAPEALLHASIFFDFRSLYGAHALAEELRLWLARVASKNSRFLHQMAENAMRIRPPLGVVRDFVLGKENRLDLKLNGITPFVDAARIFSLATEVTQTSTIQRLRQSAAALYIPVTEVDSWINAFLFIQMLRLRHHYEVSVHQK